MKSLRYIVILFNAFVVAPAIIFMLGFHVLAVAPGQGISLERILFQGGVAIALVVLTTLLAGSVIRGTMLIAVLMSTGSILALCLPVLELVPLRIFIGTIWVVTIMISIFDRPCDVSQTAS